MKFKLWLETTPDRNSWANDQAIHQANQERDNAVLTFKAKLWNKLQAQLSDVPEANHGEKFGSVEEEVMMHRLRSILNTLREEGVAP